MIPLGRIGASMAELARDREIVLYCHHGVRSLAAAEFLASQGFNGVWNLSGGIDRWSAEVDPSIPTY
jgi:adenylyltransferase/sulfurtransferase